MLNVGPAAGVSVGDVKSNICCSHVPVQVMHVAADGIIWSYLPALSSAN